MKGREEKHLLPAEFLQRSEGHPDGASDSEAREHVARQGFWMFCMLFVKVFAFRPSFLWYQKPEPWILEVPLLRTEDT